MPPRLAALRYSAPGAIDSGRQKAPISGRLSDTCAHACRESCSTATSLTCAAPLVAECWSGFWPISLEGMHMSQEEAPCSSIRICIDELHNRIYVKSGGRSHPDCRTISYRRSEGRSAFPRANFDGDPCRRARDAEELRSGRPANRKLRFAQNCGATLETPLNFLAEFPCESFGAERSSQIAGPCLRILHQRVDPLVDRLGPSAETRKVSFVSYPLK